MKRRKFCPEFNKQVLTKQWLLWWGTLRRMINLTTQCPQREKSNPAVLTAKLVKLLI